MAQQGGAVFVAGRWRSWRQQGIYAVERLAKYVVHDFGVHTEPVLQHRGIGRPEIHRINGVAVLIHVHQVGGRTVEAVAFEAAAEDQHRRTRTVVGTERAVFKNSAPKLRKRHGQHVLALLAKILEEGRHRFGDPVQQDWVGVELFSVGIEPIYADHINFGTQAAFDEPPHDGQALCKGIIGIVRFVDAAVVGRPDGFGVAERAVGDAAHKRQLALVGVVAQLGGIVQFSGLCQLVKFLRVADREGHAAAKRTENHVRLNPDFECGRDGRRRRTEGHVLIVQPAANPARTDNFIRIRGRSPDVGRTEMGIIGVRVAHVVDDAHFAIFPHILQRRHLVGHPDVGAESPKTGFGHRDIGPDVVVFVVVALDDHVEAVVAAFQPDEYQHAVAAFRRTQPL